MTVRLADLIGTKDGSNLLFATPTPYRSGSLAVRLVSSNLTGLIEVDPASGLVQLPTAPQTSDLLIGAYDDPPTVEPGVVVGPVSAFVSQLKDLSASGGNDLILRGGQSGPLLQVVVYDAEGLRQDLTGHVLYFQARKDSESGTTVFDKRSNGTSPRIVFEDQTTEPGRGRAHVDFDSSEVLAAAGNILVWDLWAKKPGGEIVPLVQDGRIEVLASVRTSFP